MDVTSDPFATDKGEKRGLFYEGITWNMIRGEIDVICVTTLITVSASVPHTHILYWPRAEYPTEIGPNILWKFMDRNTGY